MADFAVDGVLPGMMPVCHGCGALKASERGSCMLCGASYALAKHVPERADGRYFTRVVAHFLCRSCGQRSPLNALDVDGTVTCARCGLTQAYDVSVWSEALETAHGVSDLAFPKPEGRFARSGEPSIAEHPAAAVGRSRSALAFDASSVTMDGAVMRTRSISIEASPGYPLCETCHAPLFAVVEGPHLRIGCETCNTVMRYALPAASERIENLPVGIYADDCCIDRPDANMVQGAGGAIAIKCPTCNAGLEARPEQHFVSCTYCRTACRIPSRTLWALHTDKVEAKPFWLLYEGPSRMRQAYVERLRAEAEHHRRNADRAERERLEAERRAEHMRQFDMPKTPGYTRRDQLLRASVGFAVTMLVGLAIWGGEILEIVRTGRSQSGIGQTFGIGTAPPSAPPVSTTRADDYVPPVPPSTFEPVRGCTCDPTTTGLASPVSLGVRVGTTMQFGAMVTTTVDWALVAGPELVTNLGASGATAPSTVIESHALDLVVACDGESVHVLDGARITTFTSRTGAPVATSLLTEGVPQRTQATTGLVVTCTPGRVEAGAVVWSDSGSAPRQIALPTP